jgi:hypothetical protein
MNSSRPRSFIAAIVLLLGWVALAVGQEESKPNHSSCFDTAVESVPSRPTVSNGTDTTLCGVMEAEYGLERQWPGVGAHRDDLAGGLRLGLMNNLDFHWASAAFLHIMDANGDRTGFGDTWLGLKYRFLSQTKKRPSLGVFYQVKTSSASEIKGLGTGQIDHSISVLVSKDIPRVHFDFNVIPQFVGRETVSGFDKNTGFALSGSTNLTRRLGVVSEGYGYTTLNTANPAFAAAMIGFTYKVRPRFILDTGIDVGVTHNSPQKRVFVGFTYAIANMYSWMRHPR